MKMSPLSRSPRMHILLPLLAAVAVLVLCMPRTSKFNYDYRKGSAWRHETLVSPFDFPIYKTEEQMLEEGNAVRQDVIPYFRYSDDLVNRNLRSAESLQLGSYAYLRPAIIASLKALYQHGVLPDDGVHQKGYELDETVLYVQRDKRAVKYPASEVYRLSDARSRLLADVRAQNGDVNLDSLFISASVYELVVPNLVFDKQTTDLVHVESASYVSPTSGYVSAGQLIVSEGEIVTAEIAQMLDSYKREYDANVGYDGPRIFLWLGNVLLALILVGMLTLAVFFTDKTLLEDNRFLYVLLVFLIAALVTLLVARLNEAWLMAVPFTITAHYLQAFFKNRVTFIVYVVSLLPLLLFAQNGAALFFMFLAAGLVSLYTFGFFSRGWKQFINALVVFAVLMLVYLALDLVDIVAVISLRSVLLLLLGSLLTVATYPLIYLFERLFNLVSTSRLTELCDTGNPLLRELEKKAPGTFQHSLQVMNMADAAARAVNANVQLVRAGALYHDIGKIANPLCFVENESLVGDAAQARYHSGLTPQQSARDIMRHVSDGADIAARNHLPQVIIDFILSHHGTTTVKYFYNQFVNAGGDPAAVADFTYQGVRPRTKEQIILMLCDSMEAASRTLKDNSQEAYSAFVESMVADKMSAGQFEDAQISIRELGIVKNVLKSYLAQLYHERVAYPMRNKNND